MAISDSDIQEWMLHIRLILADISIPVFRALSEENIYWPTRCPASHKRVEHFVSAARMRLVL
jgi:hypothetical protein